MTHQPDFQSIGVLDSGVGGLSVLREIHRLLPEIPTLYYADQAHIPYGPRSADEIRGFVTAITRLLIDQGAGVIVIACHAASAASLHPLRQQYPHVPFVGMEPAVKPAAEATQSGVIGVLTTQATADGALYRRVLAQYAADVQVLTQVAPELVTMVEQGQQDDPPSDAVLHRLSRSVGRGGRGSVGAGVYPLPVSERSAAAGDRAAAGRSQCSGRAAGGSRAAAERARSAGRKPLPHQRGCGALWGDGCASVGR